MTLVGEVGVPGKWLGGKQTNCKERRLVIMDKTYYVALIKVDPHVAGKRRLYNKAFLFL